jgi:hypothetical protein
MQELFKEIAVRSVSSQKSNYEMKGVENVQEWGERLQVLWTQRWR